MRKSRVLEKIRNGEVARICALGSYLPYFPSLAVRAGYDGVWVDGEHKPFNPREAQALIGFHHIADIDCLWRPPTREKAALYRFLEDGASGLIIPHVEAVRFPPLGNRGLDGAAFDTGYGATGGPDYPAEANRETVLFVQIETPQALEQVEEIAALDGIDGIFLGPGDMAFRLGCRPEAKDPQMAQVQQQIARAVSRVGKTWGRPAVAGADLDAVLQAGAGFVIVGSEMQFIRASFTRSQKALDEALNGRKRNENTEVSAIG